MVRLVLMPAVKLYSRRWSLQIACTASCRSSRAPCRTVWRMRDGAALCAGRSDARALMAKRLGAGVRFHAWSSGCHAHAHVRIVVSREARRAHGGAGEEGGGV